MTDAPTLCEIARPCTIYVHNLCARCAQFMRSMCAIYVRDVRNLCAQCAQFMCAMCAIYVRNVRNLCAQCAQFMCAIIA